MKVSLGSFVGGKGDQRRVKSTKSNRERNDPFSYGEDEGDDII
jgi:hypothetical protein